MSGAMCGRVRVGVWGRGADCREAVPGCVGVRKKPHAGGTRLVVGEVVPLRLERGLREPKTLVLTITPWNKHRFVFVRRRCKFTTLFLFLQGFAPLFAVFCKFLSLRCGFSGPWNIVGRPVLRSAGGRCVRAYGPYVATYDSQWKKLELLKTALSQSEY